MIAFCFVNLLIKLRKQNVYLTWPFFICQKLRCWDSAAFSPSPLAQAIPLESWNCVCAGQHREWSHCGLLNFHSIWNQPRNIPPCTLDPLFIWLYSLYPLNLLILCKLLGLLTSCILRKSSFRAPHSPPT